ncbi:UNC-like C-terminal-domain-containing protein [Neurospora tetraspora]|uniref:UNC-like C-terminal-domain-containing protein n=1 Tax=Neurospora tetraspora TaxID=94610 RepID=A0AAE0MPC7_9PEZI|nr:UNC-like C-terminal-domain-containing protein [Neurospora tetraspora]
MRTPPTLFLGLLGLHAVAAALPEPASVCESRTVNYITHTLPQQCLRTSWTTPTAVTSAVAAETTSSEVPSNETAAPAQANETQQQQHHDQPKPSAEHTQEQTKEEQEDEDLAASTFMSFEEWKEMMLRKSGDPANTKGGQKQAGQQRAGEHDQNGPSSDTDGHGPGDDGENSLNFDALSEKVSELTTSPSGNPSTDHGSGKAKKDDQVVYEDGKTQYYRSKDAGKTCKERFSYSSFDAGATVLKTSPGAKNAKAILVENKDSYMLLECHAKSKFVIVELSDDILVDTVVLANFEFFSSMIRRFKVSVSDRYPVKLDKWVELGTFEARNSRDIQAFLVEHPQIYTKYIRIEFLSHYGNEYYCPVSLLRVHGTRMLDTWKEPDDRHDDEQETIEAPPVQEELSQTPEPEQPSSQVEQSTVASEPEPSTVTEVKEETHQETESVQVVELGFTPWEPIFYRDFSLEICALRSRTTGQPTRISPGADNNKHGISAGNPDMAKEQASTGSAAHETLVSKASSVAPKSQETAKVQPASSAASHSSAPPQASNTTTGSPNHNKAPPARPNTASNETAPSVFSAAKPSGSSSGSTTGTTARNDSKDNSGNNANAGGNSGGGSSPPNNNNKTNQQPKPNSGGSPTSSGPPASPTVQESFFKTVHKRLTHLESNTSLSLQYIEQQSRFLQDVLSKLERRQLTRVDTFLDTLNKTVLTELRNVRQQYDQIWQSTVIALETQREQTEREVVALSGRLNVLADEVVFQKRMAILQSVLLLSCLVLVIFNRTGGGGGGGGGNSALGGNGGIGGRPGSRGGGGGGGWFDSPVQAVQRRSIGSGWISNMSMSMGVSGPFPFSTTASTSGLQQQPTTAAAAEAHSGSGEDTDAVGTSTGVDTAAQHNQQQLHPNGNHNRQHMLQTQQHSYAYSRNDKALPLTPTSEYDSREGTPLVHASPLRQTSTTIDEVLAGEGVDGNSPLYTQSSFGPEPECVPDQEESSQSSSSGSESGGFTQERTSEVFQESTEPIHNGVTNVPVRSKSTEERSERVEEDDIGLLPVDSIGDQQQQTLRPRARPPHTHLGSGTVKPLPALPETSSS